MNWRKFNIAMMVVVSICLTSCSSPRAVNEIHLAVNEQLEQYPESTLIDIYKSFFQDEFGPGHMMEDTVMARQYLDYELAGMKSRGNHLVEPCGTGKQFFRVPLDLVRDNIIPKQEFLQAFFESGKTFKIPDVSIWSEKWQKILQEIESLHLEINDYESDKDAIETLLDSGEAVVHHSKAYSAAYSPSYRIISKPQWEIIRSKYNLH